jgi:DUF4097 and DUF4098 domain-containing protein YvlB
MSHRTESFLIDGPPRVFLRLPAGQARVVEGEPGVVGITMTGNESVLEKFQMSLRGDQVVIEPESGRIGRWSSVTVEIRVAAGADIHARLAAGDVVVTTEIATLTLEVGSGDVSVGSITGDARIKIASGDVRLGSVVGDVNAKTASGDIELGEVGGAVVAHSASGDIEVDRYLGSDFDAKTVSGDVRIGVTVGRTFAVDFSSLSGDVRTEFPVGTEVAAATGARLTVKTMTGDIVVRPAH